jgi:hypothetical protein
MALIFTNCHFTACHFPAGAAAAAAPATVAATGATVAATESLFIGPGDAGRDYISELAGLSAASANQLLAEMAEAAEAGPPTVAAQVKMQQGVASAGFFAEVAHYGSVLAQHDVSTAAANAHAAATASYRTALAQWEEAAAAAGAAAISRPGAATAACAVWYEAVLGQHKAAKAAADAHAAFTASYKCALVRWKEATVRAAATVDPDADAAASHAAACPWFRAPSGSESAAGRYACGSATPGWLAAAEAAAKYRRKLPECEMHDPPAPPVSVSDAASDDVEILTAAVCPANSSDSEPDFEIPAPPPMCWTCMSVMSPVFPVCHCPVVRSN